MRCAAKLATIVTFEVMDFQLIIVVVIIFLALLFASARFWRKVKSFLFKSSCSTNCGCERKEKNKTVRI